jgi:hypothetical protein
MYKNNTTSFAIIFLAHIIIRNSGLHAIIVLFIKTSFRTEHSYYESLFVYKQIELKTSSNFFCMELKVLYKYIIFCFYLFVFPKL